MAGSCSASLAVSARFGSVERPRPLVHGDLPDTWHHALFTSLGGSTDRRVTSPPAAAELQRYEPLRRLPGSSTEGENEHRRADEMVELAMGPARWPPARPGKGCASGLPRNGGSAPAFASAGSQQRGVRWSGFPGQPPSLTSEAGHRP